MSEPRSIFDRESTHYNIYALDEEMGMAHLRELFNDTTDYTLNWLIASTSGVHGWYTTIDDLENGWDNPDEIPESGVHRLTVLVIQPRIVSMRFGHIRVARDDLPWLRDVIARSLAGITESQKGNAVSTPPRTKEEG